MKEENDLSLFHPEMSDKDVAHSEGEQLTSTQQSAQTSSFVEQEHQQEQPNGSHDDTHDSKNASKSESAFGCFLNAQYDDEIEDLSARLAIYPINQKPIAKFAQPIFSYMDRNVRGGYDPHALPIEESLEILGLTKYDGQLDSLMIALSTMNLSIEEVIGQVFSNFAKIKKEFIAVQHYSTAGFPLGLAREVYQLELCQADVKLVKELLSYRWLEKGHSLQIYGGPGLGKTLLAMHLGKTAVSKGYRTMFLNASDFFLKLKKHQERHGDVIKGDLFKCKLLIVDDIGHDVPEDIEVSNLFYRLVDYRDSNSLSMIFTSNQEPAEWINCIKGLVQTRKAALDRIIHSSIIVKHSGTSSLRIRRFRKLNPNLLIK